MTRHRPTVARVDLDAIAHNVRTLRAVADGAELCAVVKADAYGHGAVPVARTAVAAGASHLAVATIEEGAQLRAAGLDGPILLFSEPPVDGVDAVLDLRLTPPLYTTPFARALADAAVARGTRATVHLAFDTGMGRVGVEPARWEAFLDALPHDGLAITGTWTHLARADEPEVATTTTQLDAFERVLVLLDQRGIDPGIVHAANSAGLLLHERARRPMVRAGIALYGLSPAPAVDAADHGLRPALSLATAVQFAKHLPAGTPVSYGHRWVTPRPGWLATLPIGYADGVPRLLTNRFEALWAGRRRPVVGTVTMDLVHLWCGQEQPRVGDEVVLLGAQGDDRLRVEDWAHTLGTITYEITCQLTARVPRIHLAAES